MGDPGSIVMNNRSCDRDTSICGLPGMKSNDDQLLARAVSGDSDALTSLLKFHGPSVRRRLSISPTWQSLLDVDDVMQVTYMEAFLRIRQHRGQTLDIFVAWLTRIAENNLRDAIKELTRAKRPNPRQRVKPVSADESVHVLLEELAATTATASRHVARCEAQSMLELAIRQLPDSYQKVVQLYDLQSQSPQEVAGAIGRSVGATHMLRARAHDRLRELMGSDSNFFTETA